MKIADKVIVVTGAGNGIGAALARRFAAERAAVVVVSDLSATDAGVVAGEIVQAGGRAVGIRTDVTLEAEICALVERAEIDFGPIDLFVSNAGIVEEGGARRLISDGIARGKLMLWRTCMPPAPCCRRCWHESRAISSAHAQPRSAYKSRSSSVCRCQACSCRVC